MNGERLTVKSREALAQAQSMARERGHQQLEAEHVLFAMLQDPEGMALSLAKKIGAEPSRLGADLAAAVAVLPQVSGGGAGQLYVAESLRRMFDAAEKAAASLHDEYISAEHFILGALESKGKAQDILTRHGFNKDSVLAALRDVRGNQRVVDEDPESKFKALDKYCVDLT